MRFLCSMPSICHRQTVMSKPSIEEILAPRPEARPRIYAYSIDDKAHKGLLFPRNIVALCAL